MAITLQALQADGTWATRNAFVTENKLVKIGQMTVDNLEALARRLMARWQTFQDGRQLRVYNSDKEPKVEPKPVKAPVKSRNVHAAEPVVCQHDWVGIDPKDGFVETYGLIDVCTLCGEERA